MAFSDLMNAKSFFWTGSCRNYLAKIWHVRRIHRIFAKKSGRSQRLVRTIWTAMTRGSHSFRASHLQWILKLSSGAEAEETSASLRRGSRHADRSTLPPIKINAFAAFLVTVPQLLQRGISSAPSFLPPAFLSPFSFSPGVPLHQRWSPMSLHRSKLTRQTYYSKVLMLFELVKLKHFQI